MNAALAMWAFVLGGLVIPQIEFSPPASNEPMSIHPGQSQPDGAAADASDIPAPPSDQRSIGTDQMLRTGTGAATPMATRTDSSTRAGAAPSTDLPLPPVNSEANPRESATAGRSSLGSQTTGKSPFSRSRERQNPYPTSYGQSQATVTPERPFSAYQSGDSANRYYTANSFSSRMRAGTLRPDTINNYLQRSRFMTDVYLQQAAPGYMPAFNRSLSGGMGGLPTSSLQYRQPGPNSLTVPPTASPTAPSQYFNNYRQYYPMSPGR